MSVFKPLCAIRGTYDAILSDKHIALRIEGVLQRRKFCLF